MLHGVFQRAAVAILLIGALVAPAQICLQHAHKARHACCVSMSEPGATIHSDCCAVRPTLPAVVVAPAVSGSVTEAAKISRNISEALYQDAEAFFAGIDKLASAKSLNEAVQIQSDMVRARGEVLVSRAKSTTEYLGKLVADGAKTAQDNLSKVYNKTA